ncbi:MAG: class I SAM-dependent methyltransferase [Chloroflexota bacterium]
MRPEISKKLIELNHQFYQTFADDFSATRQRLQPGVVQVLDAVQLNSTILDLGCGNGQLAAYLNERGFVGSYVGIDSAQKLVDIALELKLPHSKFLQADLSLSDWDTPFAGQRFNYVVCFAVMHHLPSDELRASFLKKVRKLLVPGGRFIHSNWQFLESPKLRSRILNWDTIGLSEADVDQHDYLLDWRRGGAGKRYVHFFTHKELNSLADEAGFKIIGLFSSDGDGKNLGLYQIWEPVSKE